MTKSLGAGVLKREVRVIGIDDGPFTFKDRTALVVGVVYRGGSFMDGVLSCHVNVDGHDATGTLSRMIRSSRFFPQLQVILLHGVAVGGFNMIDISALHRATGIPVLAVVRQKPDRRAMFKVLRKLHLNRQTAILRGLRPPERVGALYAHRVGLTSRQSENILNLTSTHGKIPEPLRIAHIIAAGIAKGESRGRA